MNEKKNPLKAETIKAIQGLVSNIFRDTDGKPYVMTAGECEIFYGVIEKSIKWVWASTPTRYGKTETVALACLFLAAFYSVKIPIVAGSEEKAKKIMEYIIQHIGDDERLYEGLLLNEFKNIEQLKIQMSKNALRWSHGGWIFITSVDARSISKEGEGVIGEGGDIIILEEAGLIKKKEQFSKIVRMPEGKNGWGKLVMIGNCIEGSVFETAYNDPLYYKVRIDLEQAIAEGRYTRTELEQKKLQTTTKDWKRYYLVQFPDVNEFTFFKPKKYEILPNELKYYGAVDLALGEAKGGSLVGITILGVDGKNQPYEVESIGATLTPEETIRTIFNFPYKFQRFGVESVMFQKYFLQTMEAKSKELGKFIPFQGITQTKKKEERIESMEPFINTGQILFKGDNELWEEMQTWPNPDHKDVLDSLEMAWRTIGFGGFDFAFV